MLKLIEIVILLVYYTIPFGLSLFWHFSDLFLFLLKYDQDNRTVFGLLFNKQHRLIKL